LDVEKYGVKSMSNKEIQFAIEQRNMKAPSAVSKITQLPETTIKPFDPYQNKNFQKLPGSDKKAYLKEYNRQLQRQQDAINNMSAEEFKLARDKYTELKRNSAADKMQDDFRKDFKEGIANSIRTSLKKNNKSFPEGQKLSSREIKERASKRADEIAENLAALHEPDMVAGGWHDPMPSGMGRSNVNSAIGGSWKGGRLKTMDEAADAAIARGQGAAKMNVNLEEVRGPGLKQCAMKI
jgi:filamentous hemagglutinin